MLYYEYVFFIQEKRDSNNTLVEPAEALMDRPEYLLAKDQTQATLVAGGKVPDEIKNDPDKFDRLVVVVRPF